MKKNEIVQMVLIFTMLMAGFVNGQTVVSLTFNDNSTQDIEVSAAGKIYFSDNLLYIDDGNTIPYSFDVSDIRKMTFDEPVSVKEIETEDFKVFPNPAYNMIYISGNSYGSYRYEIYSIIGNLLMRGEIENGEAIGIASLPAGMYILRVNNTSLKINKL